MNGNSKAEKIERFVKRAVLEALQETAWDHPDDAATLRRLAGTLQIRTAYNCYAGYRQRELQDVMDWKKPKQ